MSNQVTRLIHQEAQRIRVHEAIDVFLLGSTFPFTLKYLGLLEKKEKYSIGRFLGCACKIKMHTC